jgi:hypothetical protein
VKFTRLSQLYHVTLLVLEYARYVTVVSVLNERPRTRDVGTNGGEWSVSNLGRFTALERDYNSNEQGAV